MKTIFSLLALILFVFSIPINSQWVQQTLPGDINVTLGIDFINQNHGVTGGWYGNISQQIYGKGYYTTDGGSNWLEATTPDSMRVMVDVQMVSETVGYCAGAYNLPVFESASGTNQNQYQNLNPELRKFYEQIGMDFTRQENYRGYFVETTDGGQSWHPKGSFDDSVYYLIGMYFVDQQNGYVIASSEGASSNAILETTDGGNTWNYALPFQYGISIKNIRFFQQIGYLIYEDSVLGAVFISRTTDGGITWEPPQSVDLLSATKVSYLNEQTILISGVNNQFEGSVYISTDTGFTWQEFHVYDDLHYVAGIDALPNTGVIMDYGVYQPTGSAIPFVDISLNEGAIWNYSQLSQYQDYLPLYSKMVDEARWYITGTMNTQFGFVLFTDNSGGVPVELISFTADFADGKVELNWTTATELNNSGFEIERKSDKTEWIRIGFKKGKGTTTEIQNYRFTDDLFGVEPGKLYYRLKQIDYNGTYEYSDVVEIMSLPISFHLFQNYPNPFNPTTKIKFTIPQSVTLSEVEGSLVTLKVYDVATLVNEEKPAGSYEVELNAKSLPSGIYFYQLRAGSSKGQAFIQTKKMVLIK